MNGDACARVRVVIDVIDVGVVGVAMSISALSIKRLKRALGSIGFGRASSQLSDRRSKTLAHLLT